MKNHPPLETTDPTQLKWGDLEEGTKIGKITQLFPALKKEEVLAAIARDIEAKKVLDK